MGNPLSKEQDRNIRRLAGQLQSFLNGKEGRKLYQYLRENKDAFLAAAARIEKEGIFKSYCLTADGLFEIYALTSALSDSFDQKKALMEHSIKRRRLTAREFLQGIAALPEQFDLQDVVNHCVHYRAKKNAGQIVPFKIIDFIPVDPKTDTPRD